MISFSIIIPLYNKEISIEKTLRSVLAQSYSNFEIIIVNDGSTDNSLSVAESIKDDRIKIFTTPNKGVSSARNTGIARASNKYIVFLDADDIWYPNCLQEFKRLIEDFPKASVFCTSHSLNIKDIPSREKRYYVDNFYKATAESYARDVVALLCTGCVAIRKECFDQIGGFNDSMKHGEDLDMWERLAHQFIYAKSEVVTMLYRLEAENRSDKTKTESKEPIKQVSRNDILDKYHRLDYGRIYFFYIYSNFTQRKNYAASFRVMLKYGDWILSFMFLIMKIKFQKNY